VCVQCACWEDIGVTTLPWLKKSIFHRLRAIRGAIPPKHVALVIFVPKLRLWNKIRVFLNIMLTHVSDVAHGPLVYYD
jgi:hypothetical protein